MTGTGYLLLFIVKKGETVLDRIKGQMEFKQQDYNKSILGNSVIEQTVLPKERTIFFEDLNKMNLESIAKKYAPISYRTVIKGVLRKYNLYNPVKRKDGGVNS